MNHSFSKINVPTMCVRVCLCLVEKIDSSIQWPWTQIRPNTARVISHLLQHMGHLLKVYLPFNSVTEAALHLLLQPHSKRLHIICHYITLFRPSARHQWSYSLFLNFEACFKGTSKAAGVHLHEYIVTQHCIQYWINFKFDIYFMYWYIATQKNGSCLSWDADKFFQLRQSLCVQHDIILTMNSSHFAANGKQSFTCQMHQHFSSVHTSHKQMVINFSVS